MDQTNHWCYNVQYLSVNFICLHHNSFSNPSAGKASFASCRSTSYQSRCTEGIIVSNNGTLQFNLNLTFSTAGKAGLLQTVGRTIIRRTDEVILSIHSALVDTGNRQWTIEGNATTTTVTLENVVASDRGEYTIITELTDPATDYINTITKDVFATGKEGIQFILDYSLLLLQHLNAVLHQRQSMVIIQAMA